MIKLLLNKVNIGLIAILFFSSISIQAQVSKIDQRIIDVLGQEQVNSLQEKSPNRLVYLSFFLDNSYYTQDIPYHIDEKFPKVSEMSLNNKYNGITERPNFDVNNFNVLLYNFKRDRFHKKVYRVDNTDKVIVFYSEEVFIKQLNNTNK